MIEFGAAAITPRWFNRATYRRMFEYPFVECGCQMLYGRVRADNEQLLSQLARMNFNLTLRAAHVRAQRGWRALHADRRPVARQRMSKRIYRDVRRKQEAA